MKKIWQPPLLPVIYSDFGYYIFQNTILTSNVAVGQTYTQNQYQLNGVLTPLTFANTFPGTDLEIGDIIVYESYIEPDCNVVVGDVQINRLSNKYMDVDFSSNQNQDSRVAGYQVNILWGHILESKLLSASICFRNDF